ncbi:MAG: radical SAM protein [Desulfobacteraceae bacterium]|nr:MAG: radical SAM protein [Desulfobacteraceae bacterium]
MQLFSAPTAVNLELTDTCNVKCRHCYNFWRKENSRHNTLTPERFDRLIEQFREAGIFHVVLTGGEPLLQFELLEYGLKQLLACGMSVSCNSNLMLATDEKLRRLRDLGLDHILTSLNSADPDVNDYIVGRKGSHAKIIQGISAAKRNGIRISVNMIVSQINKHQVFETALLAHKLGAQKIFGTRVVPSLNEQNLNESTSRLSKEDALETLTQLVRARQETGILIGTLVGYPLCLLQDLDRFKDFVGRGCPAQSGHVIGVNADGETHACVHQEQSYGNIFEIGIRKAYENMRAWHAGQYRHPGCADCAYLDLCASGCRMSARAYHGAMDAADNLMEKGSSFSKPYRLIHDPDFFAKMDGGLRFQAPRRLRFRKENGFYLLNIRWANTVTCPDNVAEFLMQKQREGSLFSLRELGATHRELLAKLFFKDAVECPDLIYNDNRGSAGLGADILDRGAHLCST